MNSPILPTILVCIAAVSPLLTITALWQIKEWRIDRLREHMRAEGIIRQLFGYVRPIVAAIGIGAWIGMPHLIIVIATLAVLSVLNALQFFMRKQPLPVWTMKARLLVVLSMLFTGIGAWYTRHNPLFALIIPIVQPLFLLGAWMVFYPIDTLCKKRILRRATHMRNTHSEWTVVGITGSVGKTTTKELLAHILEDKDVLCTPAYVNTEIGVAQWLLQQAPAHPNAKIIIVEMGAYGRGEIAQLCAVMQPSIGIVTFIGTQHLGIFGSQEELCKAKAELLQALPSDGHAFLNADNTLCADMKRYTDCTITTVGTGGHADLEAFDIEETPSGIQFATNDTQWQVPLHGTHNTTNVLLAIGAAKKLGISESEIQKKLRTYSPPMHTFSVRKHGNSILLDDTHNCSPSSFKAGLEWARNQPYEHKILLTSGIIELGDQAEHIHSELGALSTQVCERVIFTQKRMAGAFAKGRGRPVEIWSKNIQPIPDEALLLCIGRMSEQTIARLLPPNS